MNQPPATPTHQTTAPNAPIKKTKKPMPENEFSTLSPANLSEQFEKIANTANIIASLANDELRNLADMFIYNVENDVECPRCAIFYQPSIDILQNPICPTCEAFLTDLLKHYGS